MESHQSRDNISYFFTVVLMNSLGLGTIMDKKNNLKPLDMVVANQSEVSDATSIEILNFKMYICTSLSLSVSFFNPFSISSHLV